MEANEDNLNNFHEQDEINENLENVSHFNLSRTIQDLERNFQKSLDTELKVFITSLLDIACDSLNHKNALQFLKISVQYKLDDIRDLILDFISKNFDTFYSITEIFEFADKRLINALLSREDFKCDKVSLYIELSQWVRRTKEHWVLDELKISNSDIRRVLDRISEDEANLKEEALEAMVVALGVQSGIDVDNYINKVTLRDQYSETETNPDTDINTNEDHDSQEDQLINYKYDYEEMNHVNNKKQTNFDENENIQNNYQKYNNLSNSHSNSTHYENDYDNDKLESQYENENQSSSLELQINSTTIPSKKDEYKNYSKDNYDTDTLDHSHYSENLNSNNNDERSYYRTNYNSNNSRNTSQVLNHYSPISKYSSTPTKVQDSYQNSNSLKASPTQFNFHTIATSYSYEPIQNNSQSPHTVNSLIYIPRQKSPTILPETFDFRRLQSEQKAFSGYSYNLDLLESYHERNNENNDESNNENNNENSYLDVPNDKIVNEHINRSNNALLHSIPNESNRSPIVTFSETLDQPCKQMKIIIAGDSFSGKSTWVKRLVGDKIISQYTTTVGVETYKVRVPTATENFDIDFELWDIGAGPQSGMRSSFYVFADGAILFFDVTDPQGLRSIVNWKKEIMNVCGIDIPFVVIGNKTDIVSKRKIYPLVDEPDAFIEMSARSDHGNTLLYPLLKIARLIQMNSKLQFRMKV